jgi:hypothetical protein
VHIAVRRIVHEHAQCTFPPEVVLAGQVVRELLLLRSNGSNESDSKEDNMERLFKIAYLVLFIEAVSGCMAEPVPNKSASLGTYAASAEVTARTGVREWRVVASNGSMKMIGIGADGLPISEVRYEATGTEPDGIVTATVTLPEPGVMRFTREGKVLENSISAASLELIGRAGTDLETADTAYSTCFWDGVLVIAACGTAVTSGGLLIGADIACEAAFFKAVSDGCVDQQ